MLSPAEGKSLSMACSLPFNLSSALTSNPLSRWQAWRSKKRWGEKSDGREKRRGRGKNGREERKEERKEQKEGRRDWEREGKEKGEGVRREKKGR